MCRSDHGKGFALSEGCQWAFKNLAKDTAGGGTIQMRCEKKPLHQGCIPGGASDTPPLPPFLAQIHILCKKGGYRNLP